ncbi:MAG: DUF2207 domain-containing protein [Novosphingobium sp.]|nr:DUF2207 domain-containing protein [Novosphingobium sp.]
MRLLATLAAALALWAAPCAQAEERITNFVSDVTVQQDGALDVVETIHLLSESREILRGIQRDFPTRYRSATGRQVTVGFSVLGVTRDGRAEPYTRIAMSNGERVRIGDPDQMLPPGSHVYRIHYRTTRQLGFFSDFDELYWNATGTGWTFPIEQAEARITLPAPVSFGKRAVYTGPQGLTARDATVVEERPGHIVFRTTARLEAREGLTVAAAWPKGVVAPPGPFIRMRWLLADWGAMMLAAGGTIAMIVYWAWSLRRARRHPNPRPLVPLFSSPDGLSAAAVRYIWRKKFDDRTFAAAVVDVAVRGRLRIVDGHAKDGTAQKQLQRAEGTAKLPSAEERMMRELFKSRKTLGLTRTNYAVLGNARLELAEQLQRLYGEGHAFTAAPRDRMLGWKLIGGLMLLVAFVIVLADPRVQPGVLPTIVVGLLGGRPLLGVLDRYRRRKPGKRGKVLSWIATGLIWIAIVSLAVVLVFMGLVSGNALPLLLVPLAIPFLLAARAWMVVPTGEGWALRDGILGFRHYLSVAEDDRLDKLNPPEKTVALFDRYLPYAMALNVENRWAARFTDVVAATDLDPDTDPRRDWYRGDSTHVWSDSGAFAVAMGAALTSTIASAATPPSTSGSSSGCSDSSSGSSGGGSSGGGGGGGGGSGW